MSVLRLAIPCPLRRFFDYLPPAGMNTAEIAALQAGTRLLVPFGRRQVTGYLLAVCSESEVPANTLKLALEVLDPTPLIDHQLLQLCHWAADYYHHPIGEVYNTLFPKRLREGKQPQPAGTPGYRLTVRGKGLPPEALPKSPRQAQAIDMLRQKEAVETVEFKSNGVSSTVLRNL